MPRSSCEDSKFACWLRQCRVLLFPMKDIKGDWSSGRPAAGRPLLGPELLQCWAVSANTCLTRYFKSFTTAVQGVRAVLWAI